MVERADKEERRVLIRHAILGMIRRYPQDGIFLLPTLDLLALYFQEPVMIRFWQQRGNTPRLLLSNIEDPHLLGKAREQFSTSFPSAPPTTMKGGPSLAGATVWLPLPQKDVGQKEGRIAVTVQPRNDAQHDATHYAEELKAVFDSGDFWREFQPHLAKGIIFPPLRWTEVLPGHLKSRNNALTKARRLTPAISRVVDPHIPLNTDSVFKEFDAPTEFLCILARSIDDFLLAKRSFRPLHHPGPSDQRDFANLHFCVSHALPTGDLRAKAFPYSARLFFAPSQETAFAEYLSDSGAQEQLKKVIARLCSDTPLRDTKRREEFRRLLLDRLAAPLMEYLKAPLQSASRATADLPFTSGCVAFGYSPGDSFDRAKSEEDYLRRLTESLLYGLCRPNDKGQYIFHIPVHVNGVAWMNIFTFTEKNPANDAPSWRHNYLLYHDIITDLGAAIRQRAEDAFLDVLGALVRTVWTTSITHAGTIIDALNLQLFRLALTVPLPLVMFSVEAFERPSSALRHSRLGYVHIQVSENPFFLNTLAFRPLTPSKVDAYIRKTAASAYDATLVEENRFVAYTAHQIKMPLREIRAAVNSIPHEAHRADFMRSIDWIIALEDWLSTRFDRNKVASSSFSTSTVTNFCNDIRRFVPGLRRQFSQIYGKAAPSIKIVQERKRETGNSVWTFCSTQWQAVVRTMWDNAINYGIPKKPVELIIAVANHANQPCVVLRMRNEVSVSEKELLKRVAKAQKGDMNQLGIATLTLLARRMMDNSSAEAMHRAIRSRHGDRLWEVTVPVGVSVES